MKKIVILVIVLLLCCCLSSVVAFGAIGYFEASGKCAYKGPLASVSTGACVNNNVNSTNNATANSTTNSTNTTNSTGNSDVMVKDRVYTGSSYSLTYPDTFSVDDSDATRLFVYAADGTDNLNISKKVLTISTTQSDCQSYAEDAVSQLGDYKAELVGVKVLSVGGYGACKVDFTADYGTDSGRVNQTQYYVAVGSQTYFMTITINKDEANYSTLDSIAKSITFN